MAKNSVLVATGLLTLILLWQVAALLVNVRFLPMPLDVFKEASKNLPLIFTHLSSSALRVFLAILIACVLGYPLGILAGYFKTFDRIFSPLVFCVFPIPKISFLPVAMLFLGLGNASKICIMALILLFQIIVIIRDGVKKIPDHFFSPYYIAGADFFTLCRDIILPSTYRNLFTALRNGFATSISVLFFSESYGTRFGMGYYILDSWMRVNYKQMYAGIFILSLFGIIVYFFIDFLEFKLCKY